MDKLNWFKRHKVITVILGFFVLIMIFGNSGNSPPSTTSTTIKEQEEKPAVRQDDEPTIETTSVIEPTEVVEPTRVIESAASPTVEQKQTGSSLLPTREEAQAIVKAKAVDRWADDYSMVKYEVNKQMEAYDWLAKKDEYLDIMKKAQLRWKDDYSMVKYEYEKQVESYEEVQKL